MISVASSMQTWWELIFDCEQTAHALCILPHVTPGLPLNYWREIPRTHRRTHTEQFSLTFSTQGLIGRLEGGCGKHLLFVAVLTEWVLCLRCDVCVFVCCVSRSRKGQVWGRCAWCCSPIILFLTRLPINLAASPECGETLKVLALTLTPFWLIWPAEFTTKAHLSTASSSYVGEGRKEGLLVRCRLNKGGGSSEKLWHLFSLDSYTTLWIGMAHNESSLMEIALQQNRAQSHQAEVAVNEGLTGIRCRTFSGEACSVTH